MEDINITDTMPESWEFNEEVSKVFDEMLNRSIPSYQEMCKTYITLLKKSAEKKGGPKRVLDLGCGTLTSSLPLYEIIPQCQLIGIDKSAPMIHQARNRTQYLNGIILINKDLTEFDLTEYNNIDYALSIFTLQFMPTEERYKLLEQVYTSQSKGGIIILVEKVINNNPQIETLFTESYYTYKENNGYSNKENKNKKNKLTRQLIPVTDEFNINLLESVGYTSVNIFWKNMNFTGYIGFKK